MLSEFTIGLSEQGSRREHDPMYHNVSWGIVGCRSGDSGVHVFHGPDSKGVHLMLRAGREISALPLPSVQQTQPYLGVLSTFSTAGAAKPLPSSTFSNVL